MAIVDAAPNVTVPPDADRGREGAAVREKRTGKIELGIVEVNLVGLLATAALDLAV